MSNKTINQIQLLEELKQKLKRLNQIKAIVVRGSIAKEDSDKFSDIDLLLIADNEEFIPFINQLDDYIIKNFGSLSKEGWIDSIIPNFGGIGFVYLVKYRKQLIQLDVYVLPEENAEKICNFKGKKFLFLRKKLNYRKNIDLDIHRFKPEIKEFVANRSAGFQLFFEIMLMLVMLTKHIRRKDAFLVFKYRYLVVEKILHLLRQTLEPETSGYMFYDVKGQLDKHKSEELHRLEQILSESSNILNTDDALHLFHLAVDLTQKGLPATYKNNKQLIHEVEAYIREKK